MAHSPENSAVQMTPELTKKVNEAGSAVEIAAILREAAVDQGYVIRDAIDANVLIPVEREATTRVSRTETINGKAVAFEAENALDLEKKISEAYRSATTQSNASDAPRDDKGRFTAQPTELTPAQRTQLDTEFRMGRITVEQYLEKTGAVGTYLTERGFTLDDVKATAERKYTESWASATEAFLLNSDWPGGERNLKLIGNKLAAMGLTEAEDKLAALNQAYAALKADQTLFPPDAPGAGGVSGEVADKFSSATSHEEILRLARAAAGLPSPDETRDSTWFGR